MQAKEIERDSKRQRNPEKDQKRQRGGKGTETEGVCVGGVGQGGTAWGGDRGVSTCPYLNYISRHGRIILQFQIPFNALDSIFHFFEPCPCSYKSWISHE